MKRLLAALALLASLISPVAAQGSLTMLGAGSAGAAPISGSTYDIDWTQNLCWSGTTNIVCSTIYTISNNGGYAQWVDGHWSSFGSNTLKQTDKGVLSETARTNDALWSRDLTQASWTKVGMGTALNATGIDNTASSATTLTATGTAGSCTASCTVLQTITLGSSADTYSVWLKRVTGSGTVNITINNLAGVTACTLNTSTFTRCTVTATLANPVVGIQLTALSDVVIADFNQLEPGGFPTSPILTTTATATRNGDKINLTGGLATVLGTFTFSAVVTTTASENTAAASVTMYLLDLDNDTNNDPLYFGSTVNTLVRSFPGTLVTATIGGAGTYLGTVKAGLATTSGGNTLLVANNGTVTTSTAHSFSATTAVGFLTQSAGGQQYNGYSTRATFWNTALSSANLAAQTVP